MTLKEGATATTVTLAAVSALFVGKVALSDDARTLACWTRDAQGAYTERRTIIARTATGDEWTKDAASLKADVARIGGCIEVAPPTTWDKLTGLEAAPVEQPYSCVCPATKGPPCLDLAGKPIDRTALASETQGGAGCVPRPCGGAAGFDPIPEACR
jgi:hypothetical protein